MQVALLSDSHGSKDKLKKALNNINEKGIKYVIHAGDFAVYGVDEILRSFPDINFYIAQGNCDINSEILDSVINLPNVTLAEVTELELEGKKLAASHIEGVAQFKLKNNADIFCHGHTHRPKIQTRNKTLVLNPGAICENGFYFVIELKDLSIEAYYFNGAKLDLPT